MSRNTSVSLDPHFVTFIETQIDGGRYNSASDVMRAGLRLLEERETKLAALRAALVAGEQSGTSSRDVRDIWAAVKDELSHGTDG